MLWLRPPRGWVFDFDDLLGPVSFLLPTIHLFLFTIFPLDVRFAWSAVLDPLYDPKDNLLPQPLRKAPSYHIPQSVGDSHSLPVPHIGTGS